MKLFICSALALGFNLGCALAAGIAWQNNDSDPLPMIQADGSYLDNSFRFELGTFEAGFDPAAQPFHLWYDNWKLLDEAYAPVASGWNSVNPGDPGHDELDPLQPAYNEQFVTSTMTFNSNGTVQGLSGSSIFTAGESVYVWVFNDRSFSSNMQWALFRDSSADFNPFPTSPNWVTSDPAGLSSDFWSIDEGDLAIVGAVKNLTTDVISRGEGAYTDDLGGAFRVQTTVIPEPSSALLALVSGLSLHLRRRRRFSAP